MKLKQTLAAGLSAAMLLTCAACSSNGSASSGAADVPVDADAAVMTINGLDYTAAEYAAFLNNAHTEWTTYLSYYGMTEEDYLEQMGEDSYESDLRGRAEDYLVLNTVLKEKMSEYGLALEELDESVKETYRSMGMDDSYLTLQQMLEEVSNYCTGEGGPLRPTDAEIESYFNDNYLRCKHVLVKTVDDSYNELENQDELEATANDIAKRAQAGEDFDALIAEYGEDPGMESNPDGYVFTEGTMVDEFYQGTLALAEGGVSDPVKSSYGWHIIQRLPLRSEDLESAKDEIVDLLANFDGALQGWADAAEVNIAEDAGKITIDNCASYLPKE